MSSTAGRLKSASGLLCKVFHFVTARC